MFTYIHLEVVYVVCPELNTTYIVCLSNYICLVLHFLEVPRGQRINSSNGALFRYIALFYCWALPTLWVGNRIYNPLLLRHITGPLNKSTLTLPACCGLNCVPPKSVCSYVHSYILSPSAS